MTHTALRRFSAVLGGLWSRPVLAASLLVLVVEIVGYGLDPHPQFFQGDSNTYLGSAKSGVMLPSRCFLYPKLLRWIALSSCSLSSMIILQVVLSGATSILVGFALHRFLRVRPGLVVLAALTVALAPLQLYYARAILTENISTFFFVLLLVLGFAYLSHPRLLTLVLIQIAGVILVALRVGFVPAVWVTAVMLPLLAVTRRMRDRPSWGRLAIWFAVHWIVSCGSLLALHHGYKVLNGRLAHREAAYSHSDGFFLLAAWVSILEPEDATDPDLAGILADPSGKYPRDTLHFDQHRWARDGIVERWRKAKPSRPVANEIARDTALNALRNRPWEAAGLAWTIYRQYFSELMAERLVADEGGDRLLMTSFVRLLRDAYCFTAPADWGRRSTLTKSLHRAARPWYDVVAAAPWVVVVTLILWRRRATAASAYLLVVTIAAMIPVVSMTAVVRFLHPLEVVTILALAMLLDVVVAPRAGKG